MINNKNILIQVYLPKSEVDTRQGGHDKGEQGREHAKQKTTILKYVCELGE